MAVFLNILHRRGANKNLSPLTYLLNKDGNKLRSGTGGEKRSSPRAVNAVTPKKWTLSQSQWIEGHAMPAVSASTCSSRTRMKADAEARGDE
jgi:hypothetical protein